MNQPETVSPTAYPTRRVTRYDEILGTVRLCRTCGEEWPQDETFWYFDRHGRVLGRCRACWADRNAAAWASRKSA